MNHPKPTIQVSAAVIEEQGQYLITQRGEGGHLPGYWEFPGGKREAGESLEECLHREIREELGLVISRLILFQALVHEYADHIAELHFFCASIAHGRPRPLGCAAWRWVPAKELTAYQFPPADAPIIAKILDKNGCHG